MRIEDRYDTGIDDLWSALTDPGRLARWYGQVEGDLRPGGAVPPVRRSRWHGRHRAGGSVRAPAAAAGDDQGDRRVLPRGHGVPPYDEVIEATLTADGDQTILVIEVRGMPLDKIAFYGAGWQIHAENSRRLPRRARARRHRGAVGRARPCLSGPGRQHRLAGTAAILARAARHGSASESGGCCVSCPRRRSPAG